jgi:hypothetical protein
MSDGRGQLYFWPMLRHLPGAGPSVSFYEDDMLRFLRRSLNILWDEVWTRTRLLSGSASEASTGIDPRVSVWQNVARSIGFYLQQHQRIKSTKNLRMKTTISTSEMKENPMQRPAKETKNDKRSKEERKNVVKRSRRDKLQ